MRAKCQEMELCFREHFKSLEVQCLELGVDPEEFFKKLAEDEDETP